MSVPIERTLTIPLTEGNAVTSEKWKFELRLPYPLSLQKHKVTLMQAQIYNAIPNISPTYNNTYFQYTSWDGNLKTVNLLPNNMPGAMMEVEALEEALHHTMRRNNDYLLDENKEEVFFLTLTPNVYYNAVELNTHPVPQSLPIGWSYPGVDSNGKTPSGEDPPLPLNINTQCMQMVIPTTGFASLLGFTEGFHPREPTKIDEQPGITQIFGSAPPMISPVTSLIIKCNLAGDNIFSSVENYLSSVIINAGSSGLITHLPAVITFTRIPEGIFSSIWIKICDQNGNEIRNLLANDSNLFTLVIEERE